MPMGDAESPGPRVRVARGARAAERDVIDEVLRLVSVAGSPSAPDGRRVSSSAPLSGGLLAPVWVIVPSRSLCEHLSATLVRERPALLGVEVQTLARVAHRLAGRTGPLRVGDALLGLLVRRAVRGEPDLHRELAPLEEAESVVVGAVRDLLDAGFEPVHLDALEEAVAAAGDASAAALRVQALLRIACRVQREAERLGTPLPAEVHRRAREVLEREGREALPARAVLVHGFADATGVASDLLRALVRHADAQVWIPGPDDPVLAETPGERLAAPGDGFTLRLREALGVPDPPHGPGQPAPALRLVAAAGANGELRAVADQIRRLLDEGQEPERIGIVARDLGPYRWALSGQLRRLGIPFSGGCGFPTRTARQLRALLELLREGPRTPTDTWLDAAEPGPDGSFTWLRSGLHALGAGRLGPLADLAPASYPTRGAGMPLRAVKGFLAERAPGSGEEREEDGEDSMAVEHERLPRGELEAAVQRARATLRLLERMGAEAPWPRQCASVRRLTREVLHWPADGASARALEKALEVLGAQLETSPPLSLADLRSVLAHELVGAGEGGLGGEGAGVQVLDAMQARGRTFDVLFMIGLGRERFPRAVVDDPLLPDRWRGVLAGLLQDMPVKSRGYDEERHLFAWLCSAAPQVTLSWQAVSEDGRECPRSPLVERLRLARPDLEVERAPHPLEAPSPIRPGFEHLMRAGLRGDRAGHRALWELLLAAPEARARARVVAALEAGPEHEGRGPGPYAGLVGPLGLPRRGLFVTALEQLSRCPWQYFLRRRLGLQPAIDALVLLPEVDGLLVGQLVHEVLERLVGRAGAQVRRPLADALEGEPVDVPWPKSAELPHLLRGPAQRVVREQGLGLPGLPDFLAHRARPQVERLGELVAPAGVIRGVLGAEIEATIGVARETGPKIALHFRADRVDRVMQGEGGPELLLLDDYKTGQPFTTAKRAVTRRGHLLKQIGSGLGLQLAAYASLTPPDWGCEVQGRLVYTSPGLGDEQARVVLCGSEVDWQEPFELAVRTLVEAIETGALPPRLLDGTRKKEPHACTYCELSEACVRGDSSARRRFEHWWTGEGMVAGEPEPVAAARRVLDLHASRRGADA